MSDSKCPGRQLGSKTAFSFKSLVEEYKNLPSHLASVQKKNRVLRRLENLLIDNLKTRANGMREC